MADSPINLNFLIFFMLAMGMIFNPQDGIALDRECLMYPQPGHRVDIIDLHPSDKQYPMLGELKKLKLVLMEPGVCVNKDLSSKNQPWHRARLFIIQGKTESFQTRGTVDIEAGRFK